MGHSRVLNLCPKKLPRGYDLRVLKRSVVNRLHRSCPLGTQTNLITVPSFIDESPTANNFRSVEVARVPRN